MSKNCIQVIGNVTTSLSLNHKYLMVQKSIVFCVTKIFALNGLNPNAYTLHENTIKSSPKTFSEKLSGPFSMLEWQGPLIGASPSLLSFRPSVACPSFISFTFIYQVNFFHSMEIVLLLLQNEIVVHASLLKNLL